MDAASLRVRTERSLVYEIAVKEQEAPLSCAMGYVDDLLLEQDTSLTPTAVKRVFLEGLPFIAAIVTTPWGRIATVILPRFQSEVFEDEEALLSEAADALKLCGRLGARCVSLTGLIPSATANGEKMRQLVETLTEQAPPGQVIPHVTTGHATTTACMCLNIQKIMEEAGRELTGERVAYLGLGSVGLATLRLMLRVLPHPKCLVLCDVWQKEDELTKLAAECRDSLGFAGDISLSISRTREAPAEIYGCSMIVAATNVGDILDADKLRPGTCVVDDSAPHVFGPTKMWARIRERRDVLATEGGPMRIPQELRERYCLPKRWSLGDPDGFAAGTKKHAREMMGCTLSGLLTALEPHRLPPQTGAVALDDSEKHFHKLMELGCEGCGLNIDEEPIPEECIVAFRKGTAAP